MCDSCKIFFRRAVKNKKKLECQLSGYELCDFDKWSRNKCRKCRYEKCIKAGMNPLLIDSCKKKSVALVVRKSSPCKFLDEDNNQAIEQKNHWLEKNHSLIETFSSRSVYITESMNIQILSSLNGYFTQTFCDNHQKICETLFKKQKYFTLYTWGLKSLFEQHSSGTPILFSKSFYNSYIEFETALVKKFLETLLDKISARTKSDIVSETSQTYIGLVIGLEVCFRNHNVFEQCKNAYPCVKRIFEFWAKTYPHFKTLKGIPFEAYSCYQTPWAANFEDEVHVATTFKDLEKLVDCDPVIAKLMTYLVIFSPLKVKLTTEESSQLKTIQSQLTMMIYNYLLSRPDYDNMMAMARVSKLNKIVADLNKSGEILASKVINFNDGEFGRYEDIINIDLWDSF